MHCRIRVEVSRGQHRLEVLGASASGDVAKEAGTETGPFKEQGGKKYKYVHV